jgi:hypothetical protein
MVTEKMDKEAQQHRSEIQLLHEQLELALKLNSGDFLPIMRDLYSPLLNSLFITGAEDAMRLVVSERMAASAAAARMEDICRQLEQQVPGHCSQFIRSLVESLCQVAFLKVSVDESATVRFLLVSFCNPSLYDFQELQSKDIKMEKLYSL